MSDQIEEQSFPLGVVVWLDNILIDHRKQYLRFETDAHERAGACFANRFDGAIQGFEMIFSVRREEVKIFLDEKPEDLRSQRADLCSPVRPHWFFGKASLAECHSAHLHRAQSL